MLFEKIKKGNYDADDPIWENISPEAKDVVAKLLTVDSDKRLTAEEALGHPWVQGKTPTTVDEGEAAGGPRGLAAGGRPIAVRSHASLQPYLRWPGWYHSLLIAWRWLVCGACARS